ncbi:hypothetical protein MTO96_036583 [Rhipicephalus appendiculatus]
MRKAYRTALGVPRYTETHRLLELGMHNENAEDRIARKAASHQYKNSHSRPTRDSIPRSAGAQGSIAT